MDIILSMLTKPVRGTPITIREEQTSDVEAIDAIIQSAFNGVGEAAVVARLRTCCEEFVSLIAQVEGQLVGHILFTPVTIIGSAGTTLTGMGLAPLAVHPDFQCQGVGTALCQRGLERIKERRSPFVVVLGAQRYYRRFGFEPAARYGVSAAFAGISPETFMIKVFAESLLGDEIGSAHYHPEFDSVSQKYDRQILIKY